MPRSPRTSKLFSGASTAFGGEPNTPRLAGRCRDAGHAARDQRGVRPPGGAHRSRAEREDQSALGVRPQELLLSGPAAGLPDQPVQVADRGRGRGDALELDGGRSVTVGIERLHLEQDAGKLLHDQSADDVLCRPQPLRRRADGDRLQARHPADAAEQARGLRHQAAHSILRYLGTCDGDMEKGSLRADVNVSVRTPRRVRSAPAARSRT